MTASPSAQGWYERGPGKSDAPTYTRAVVSQAIDLYDAIGRDDTVAYYNDGESVDGQWYVFIFDPEAVMLAHAANPALVGQPASVAVGPNNFPAGEAVVAAADEDGAWFSYAFTNPDSGAVEAKHSWVVEYDGLTFGSGWYERGPSKSDAPTYTKAVVSQAIDLYDAIGRDDTVAYYKRRGKCGRPVVRFHHRRGRLYHSAPQPDVSGPGPEPSCRRHRTIYGDDLLGATESGRWVDYVLVNPETGDDRQKHTWAVRYDGLVFASGWYE